eukprot:Awhi_evm1s1324
MAAYTLHELIFYPDNAHVLQVHIVTPFRKTLTSLLTFFTIVLISPYAYSSSPDSHLFKAFNPVYKKPSDPIGIPQKQSVDNENRGT